MQVSGEGDLDTWNSGGIKTFVHGYKPLKYLNRNLRVKNNKNVKIALSITPLSLFFGHQSKDWLLKGQNFRKRNFDFFPTPECFNINKQQNDLRQFEIFCCNQPFFFCHRKQGQKLRRLMTFAWPCLLPKQCVVSPALGISCLLC